MADRNRRSSRRNQDRDEDPYRNDEEGLEEEELDRSRRGLQRDQEHLEVSNADRNFSRSRHEAAFVEPLPENIRSEVRGTGPDRRVELGGEQRNERRSERRIESTADRRSERRSEIAAGRSELGGDRRGERRSEIAADRRSERRSEIAAGRSELGGDRRSAGRSELAAGRSELIGERRSEFAGGRSELIGERRSEFAADRRSELTIDPRSAGRSELAAGRSDLIGERRSEFAGGRSELIGERRSEFAGGRSELIGERRSEFAGERRSVLVGERRGDRRSEATGERRGERRTVELNAPPYEEDAYSENEEPRSAPASELRRRTTATFGSTAFRRSRVERSGEGLQEIGSGSPLPPDPAPVDFPLESSFIQNGNQGREEQDAGPGEVLYPTEKSVLRERSMRVRPEDTPQRAESTWFRPDDGGQIMDETGQKTRSIVAEDRGQGSLMDPISAETYSQQMRSRQMESHYSTLPKMSSAAQSQRMSSGRLLKDRTLELSSELRKSKAIEEIRRRSGEMRVSSKKLPSYTILKEEEVEVGVKRHGSVLLPVLEDIERVFHDLVAAGDIEGTKIFLEEHPGFNINCVNYQKISALHVAVKEQNEAMVEFLLQQKDLDISDCVLYAIKGGNLKIVEMILDSVRQKSPRLEYAGATHSVDFSDDMTPIILAAQLGNYEIINFLLKRGHSIPPVHAPFCKCDVCRGELKKYDRLRYSTMKLNLYKAICNPMYMFQTTDDPFQRAFELVKELQDAAMVFPQFKGSFQELWESLRKFTTDLIGCCRNAQEVEIVLKKSPYSVTEHVIFPRLQYAIDLKQKEFVSHPYTQAVLGDAWTGDLLEWKIRSPLMQSLAVIPRIPMLPVMTVMCIFLPTKGIVKKWKTPVNKMISSVASYLIFLIILFLESNLDKTNQKRGPPNSGLEGIIIIYVVGYIWLNIRICFKQGIKRFFTTMWHWYDTIMLFLFTMTIVFWIASWVDITANGDIDLPRKYWNALDPELIAEGFFAAAVIMAFFRLNLFLSLNYHLGPLQVSIGKMTLDIFRFIIIFSIIILAWCAGLCRFYQPYDGMVQKDAASGSNTTQVSSFVSFLMTLKTFFWAIFGMSPIESADVVIENLPGDTPDTTIINKHQFTETVGYIAFALFQFLSVVVVLNMLVACMANTFTKVIDNVAVEWVFGRSQIYLSFMASSILPPPFNLVPTLSGIKDMITWFRLLGKSSGGQRAKCNLTHCCYIESDTEPYVNLEFPVLMSELAQRYIRLKAQIEAEEATTELEEVKTELNDMKDLLRKLCVVNKC